MTYIRLFFQVIAYSLDTDDKSLHEGGRNFREGDGELLVATNVDENIGHFHRAHEALDGVLSTIRQLLSQVSFILWLQIYNSTFLIFIDQFCD